MKWLLLSLLLLLSCDKDTPTDTTTDSHPAPAATAEIQKLSHDIAAQVEAVRGLKRSTDQFTLRLDTNNDNGTNSSEEEYFGPLTAALKQQGFFTMQNRARHALPVHWPSRYRFWEGDIGGYFMWDYPNDIALVVSTTEPQTISSLLSEHHNQQVVAHEYTHLLQEHNGLLRTMATAEMTNPFSFFTPMLAVEGDATFTMDLWGSAQFAGQPNLDSLIDYQQGEVDIYLDYLFSGFLPDFDAFFLAHYIYGTLLVGEQYQAGGTAAIDSLFTQGSPKSLGEIMGGATSPTTPLAVPNTARILPNAPALYDGRLGSPLLSILLNRISAASLLEKTDAFTTQYKLLNDRYIATEGAPHSTLWAMEYETDSAALFAFDIFCGLNTAGSMPYRSGLNELSSFSSNGFIGYKYGAQNFTSYVITKGAQLWVIDNPAVDEAMLLTLL